MRLLMSMYVRWGAGLFAAARRTNPTWWFTWQPSPPYMQWNICHLGCKDKIQSNFLPVLQYLKIHATSVDCFFSQKSTVGKCWCKRQRIWGGCDCCWWGRYCRKCKVNCTCLDQYGCAPNLLLGMPGYISKSQQLKYWLQGLERSMTIMLFLWSWWAWATDRPGNGNLEARKALRNHLLAIGSCSFLWSDVCV